jgi:aspartate racemase
VFASKHKVIGILGGMGPRATMDLYNEILLLSEVVDEQDHIATLIYSNPKIPDRSANYSGPGHEQMVEYLIETAQKLELGGADVIVIPCNGVHSVYQQIAQSVTIEVLNMIEEVAAVTRNYQYEKVLLLGTKATTQSGLYQQAFADLGTTVVLPTPDEQAIVMDVIYGIKLASLTTSSRNDVIDIIERCDLPVIMGCTELPLVLSTTDTKLPLINPTAILASAAVTFIQQNNK